MNKDGERNQDVIVRVTSFYSRTIFLQNEEIFGHPCFI